MQNQSPIEITSSKGRQTSGLPYGSWVHQSAFDSTSYGRIPSTLDYSTAPYRYGSPQYNSYFNNYHTQQSLPQVEHSFVENSKSLIISSSPATDLSFVGSVPVGSFGSHYDVGVNFEVPRSRPVARCDMLEASIGERAPLLAKGERYPPNAFNPAVDCEKPPIQEVAIAPLPEVTSSFSQSVFNALNVLMGIAVLSLPLAFQISGWALGFLTLLSFALITRYTASLLQDCMDADRSLITYADIGQAAFGQCGRQFLTVVLIGELFAVSVAVNIMLVDSMIAVQPELAGYAYLPNLIAWAILTPTTWLALRFLAYGSVLGVISTVFLTMVVVVDGLSKRDAPGSLWNWAEITPWPSDWSGIPMSFGLIMAGFAGHSVLPSIYRDMSKPNRFPVVANISYIIVMMTYASMAFAGYLMFGNGVMREITQNIALIPVYPRMLTYTTLYLFLLIPITKYALNLSPVFTIFECRLLGVERLTRARRIASRTALSTIICLVGTLVPSFHRVVSLMGSLNAFTICVIFPILCHWWIFGRRGFRKVLDGILLIGGVACAVTGTVWSFL